MRILLDTNIFIPLEDSSINIDDQLAKLSRISSGKHNLLIHPATKFDIDRDKNEDRRNKSLSRIKKYQQLEAPPEFGPGEEQELMGEPRKDNDRIDNLILLSLLRNCTHWLVTRDAGIHRKARALKIDERVLSVDQAILALEKIDNHELKLYPNIVDVACHSLDLEDEIFNSLRTGYDFDNWFINKCAQTGRRAWVCRQNGEIGAICIYKEENSPIINTDSKGLQGKTLKLCTFKVVRRGYKIGELLLKQAFTHAIKNKFEHIYLTTEPGKHELLEDLLIDFGFHQEGIDLNERDTVYVKDLPAKPPKTNDTPLEYAIKFFPNFKVTENSAYLIPIKPKYHKVLFPESEWQQDLFLSTDSSAGNAIKQAYICNSPSKSIRPGDILFFYRTQDIQAITTFGIVDQFHIESDPEKIYQWVAKRTVYDYSEIKEMSGKSMKVILFRLFDHLQPPIGYQKIKDLGIISGPIQSITKISKESTIKIIQEAGINDCLISN